MTIKNTDKNVSAENLEDVVINASFNNGILTLIRKNLYDESVDDGENGKNIHIDISDHKLKLKILNSKEALDQLEASTTEAAVKEKNSYVFLVPFENAGEEGVYREYIWIEDEHDTNGGEFEVIGSTKTDLEPYFKKSDVVNNLTTTEAGKALDARQGKILNDKFGDYLTTTLASSTYVAKETGKGLSTNDFTTAEKTKLANIQIVDTVADGNSNAVTSNAVYDTINGLNYIDGTDYEEVEVTVTYANNGGTDSLLILAKRSS